MSSSKLDSKKAFSLCNYFFNMPLTHGKLFFKIKTIWEREKGICVSLYITQPTKILLALALGSMKTISLALTFKALFGMWRYCKKTKFYPGKSITEWRSNHEWKSPHIVRGSESNFYCRKKWGETTLVHIFWPLRPGDWNWFVTETNVHHSASIFQKKHKVLLNEF